MKKASSWLTIRYHGRAIFRACLAEWYGVLDWFAARWPLTQEEPTPPRALRGVAVYPRRGPASRGQIAEWRVVLLKDEQGKEIATLAEGVDQYLYFLERYSAMAPLHRHT